MQIGPPARFDGAPFPQHLQQPPGTQVSPYRAAVPQWPMPIPRRAPSRSRPLDVRELLALGAFVVLFDVVSFRGDDFASGGYGLALLFTLCPVGLFAAARARRLSPRLACTGAMLGAVALRCAYSPTAMNALAGFALAFLFALSLRVRRVFVPEALLSALGALRRIPSRVRATFRGTRVLLSRTRMGRVAILPIFIPFALAVAFGAVFAFANPVVAHVLDVSFSFVARVIHVPSAGRVFFWGATVLFGATLLRPAIRLARGTDTAAETQEATPTSLLVARNGLVVLNVMFLAYNALDATFLWSGKPPSGMRTQQYAHLGAFWLTVALVMLTGVVGIMFRGALSRDERAKHARTMAYVLMGQGFVLALGTYRRIAIHIAYSGLSDLRIVGILGTTLVVIGVALVARKLHATKSFTWLLRRQLDAFAVTAVLYLIAPTHLIAAQVNVSRIERGENRPIVHMFRQSREPESAPVLIALLDHPDLRVRQGAAELLENEREILRGDVAGRSSWRERDIASQRALAAIDNAAPRIAEVLGDVDRSAARQVLREISRLSNDDATLEDLLAIPDAAGWSRSHARSSY